jgi:hypothetical protein
MADLIELRCTKCSRSPIMVARQETDYPEAVRVETVCPDCDEGDFAEVLQFDAEGKHITRDPKDKTP